MAPLFKTGKWASVPADRVDEDFIRYMLTREDLYPAVRSKLEAELARRGRMADASGDESPARPLVARRPAKAELLPEELQGGEAIAFTTWPCAHCGRVSVIRGVVEVK